MTPPDPGPAIGEFGVGLAAGVLLAVLTSVVPVAAIVGVGALVAASWIATVRGRRRFVMLAGATLGSGLALLWGSLTTVQSCSQTSDFCGQANVLPLLVFAAIAVTSGSIVSVISWRRAQP